MCQVTYCLVYLTPHSFINLSVSSFVHSLSNKSVFVLHTMEHLTKGGHVRNTLALRKENLNYKVTSVTIRIVDAKK